MEHIGIDLGSSSSAICVVNGEGAIVQERDVRTRSLAAYLKKRPTSRVVMESCAESRKVAQLAESAGHEVRVVPSTLVRSLGIGTRKIKTDRRDAQNLAVASLHLGDALPHIHVRSDASAELQALIRARGSLVSQRTTAINFVRAHLRRELLGRGPRCNSENFAMKVREQFGESLGVGVNAQLAVIDTLNEQIAALDQEIKNASKEHEALQRLQKITGVGPIVALAFYAAIDDPRRFASCRHVGSYLGLSPGERTTGGKVRRTGIIGAGQRQLRALLVQAAHSMLRARRTREPLAEWALELKRKSGRKVAVCALARRLAVVMWAMLRDGTSYDPLRTRSRSPRPKEVHVLVLKELAGSTGDPPGTSRSEPSRRRQTS